MRRHTPKNIASSLAAPAAGLILFFTHSAGSVISFPFRVRGNPKIGLAFLLGKAMIPRWAKNKGYAKQSFSALFCTPDLVQKCKCEWVHQRTSTPLVSLSPSWPCLQNSHFSARQKIEGTAALFQIWTWRLILCRNGDGFTVTREIGFCNPRASFQVQFAIY